MARDFEEVLNMVGSSGRYQKWLVNGIFYPVSFIVGLTSNLIIFQLVVPDYWCHVPGQSNTSLTHDQWKDLTIPRSNTTGQFAKCEMFVYEWSNGSYVINNDTTQACTSGWEYDRKQFTETVATSYEWVCERDHYTHNVLSVYMAGTTVGTLVLPIIADKFLGRRNVFFVTLVLHIVFTLPLLLASDIVVHNVLRFLQGLPFETNYLMIYIIVMEMISVDARAQTAMISFVAWTMGMCFSALLAWLIPHWQHLALITCLPQAFCFIYWRLLPESPRWLLARGEVERCTDILVKVGRENQVTGVTREQLQQEIQDLLKFQPAQVPLTTIFFFPKLTLRAAILLTLSFCMFGIYGILYLGINVLPDNNFLSHFILSSFEFPSNLLGWLFIHFLGRRFTCYATFLLIAIFCIAATFSLHNPWLLVIMVATTKLFATQGIYIVFVMASEIFPTPIRTSGFGITIVFSMLGMVVAPHILHANMGETFKYWVILGMTAVSAVVCLPLPETLGLPLPQTFQDAEDVGRDRPFTTWIHHWNLHRYPPPPPSVEHNKPQETISFLQK